MKRLKHHRDALHQLQQAIVEGNRAAFHAALKRRPAINALGPAGATALMLACSFRNPESVADLLRHGADPNVIEPLLKRNALHWICVEYAAGNDRDACESIMQRLIKSGANLTARDATGQTPLALAKSESDSTVNKLLSDAEPLKSASKTGAAAARSSSMLQPEEEAKKSATTTKIDTSRVAAWVVAQQLTTLRDHLEASPAPKVILVRSVWMGDYEDQFLRAVADQINQIAGGVCAELPLVNKLAELHGDKGTDAAKIRSIRASILKALNGGKHLVCTALGSQLLDPSLAELVTLEMDLPRFQPDSLALALTDLTGQAWTLDATTCADWAPLVAPFDLAAASHAPAARLLAELEQRVRSRLAVMQPGGASIPLLQLHGLGEAREWALDLVSDLTCAQSGKIPWSDVDRGALLCGPPGVGKTTLARAIASQAGIRLLATTASKWQSSGHLSDVLQSMTSDFERAVELSPCILFIDEIDAVGSRESSGQQSQTEWVTWTVNHLLGLMDGFARKGQIVVVGASNHPDKVDPALRRAGRLDRLIHIPLPNSAALKSIYEHYLSGCQHSLTEADIKEVVACSIGVSGAEVERYVREARRRSRKEQRALTVDHLMQSVFETPRENCRTPLAPAILEQIAYHEAGHAIMSWLGPEQGRDIRYISVLPRSNGTGGFMSHRPTDEMAPMTRARCRQRLATTLGGRAAEEVRFGVESVGSGSAGDLANAITIARRMIQNFGLAKNGRLSYVGAAESLLAEEIEDELQEAYLVALHALQERRGLLDAVAQALIQKSELTGSEFLSLVDQQGQGVEMTHRRRNELRAATAESLH